MAKDELYPRLIEKVIAKYAEIFGGIYILGPKTCGKTTTASHLCQFKYRLSVAAEKRQVMNMIHSPSPEIVFDVPQPVLFDEWQEVCELWDMCRNYIDENSCENAIYLTGSRELSEEEKKNVSHSGTGRIVPILMRPMSLYESRESTGDISLFDLSNPDFRITRNLKSNLALEDLIYLTCRGGWPKAVLSKSKEASLLVAKNIVDTFCEGRFGDNEEEGDRFDANLMRRLLYSYARNDSTLAANKKILKDILSDSESKMSEPTFYKYKSKLEAHYLIEDLPSWSPLFKSRVNMTSTDKKEFVDPSLAVASALLSPKKLLNSLYDYGFFFENMCLRDLRIYAQVHGGEVRYYHDRNGLEANAVVVYDDGSYILIEIKLGTNQFAEAEKHLLTLRDLIKKHNEESLSEGRRDLLMEMPSSLVILTGHNQAMTLPSGVHIVPIGCLKD